MRKFREKAYDYRLVAFEGGYGVGGLETLANWGFDGWGVVAYIPGADSSDGTPRLLLMKEVERTRPNTGSLPLHKLNAHGGHFVDFDFPWAGGTP